MLRALLIVSIIFCFSSQCRVFCQETPSQILRSVSVVLSNPRINEEFGMLDKQVKELRTIVEKFQTQLDELRESSMVEYNKRRSEGAEREVLREILEFARIDLAEKTKAQSEEFTREIGRILVPHQIKKIKQVDFALRIGAYGSPFLLFEKAYGELGMNPEEEKEARTKLAELKKNYIKEYNKLNKSFYNDVLKSLGKERAGKLKDLVGAGVVFPTIR